MWAKIEKITAGILIISSVIIVGFLFPPMISNISYSSLFYNLFVVVLIRLIAGPVLLTLLFLSGSPSSREYLTAKNYRVIIPILYLVISFLFLLPMYSSLMYSSSNGNALVLILLFEPLFAYEYVRRRFTRFSEILVPLVTGLLVVLYFLFRPPYLHGFSSFAYDVVIPIAILTFPLIGIERLRHYLRNPDILLGIYGVIILLITNLHLLTRESMYSPLSMFSAYGSLSFIAYFGLSLIEIILFFRFGYSLIKEEVALLTGITGWFRYYLVLLVILTPIHLVVLLATYFVIPIFLSFIFLTIPLFVYAKKKPSAEDAFSDSAQDSSKPEYPRIVKLLINFRNILFAIALLSPLGMISRGLPVASNPISFVLAILFLIFYFAPIFLILINVVQWIVDWLYLSHGFSMMKLVSLVLMGLLTVFYFIGPVFYFLYMSGSIVWSLFVFSLTLISFSPMRQHIDEISGGRFGNAFTRICESSISTAILFFVTGPIVVIIGLNFPYYMDSYRWIFIIVGIIIFLIPFRGVLSTFTGRMQESLRLRDIDSHFKKIDQCNQNLIEMAKNPPLLLYTECEDLALQDRTNAYVSYRALKEMNLAQNESTRLEDAIREIDNQFLATMDVMKDMRPLYQSVEDGPSASTTDATSSVEVLRGCEIIGGTFEYKPKIMNRGTSVVTNVTATIVAYPDDCLELAGESSKTISRIEVGGFRSPQFLFTPSKDCVEGTIVASVSYFDARDQLNTIEVNPYRIRSVCDLLVPLELEKENFGLILGDMTSSEEEEKVEWNAQVLFTKTRRMMRSKNFHIVDAEEHVSAGQFVGTIRGLAEGKYTNKRVAVIVAITGNLDGNESIVKVEALGEDIAMLPTTIYELGEGIKSWTCVKCGAPLQADEVTMLKSGMDLECGFCFSTLKSREYIKDG